MKSKIKVITFIQARMSSTRFPGKVLAPFAGEPMIKHVIDRIVKMVPYENLIVLTSTDRSDDPLAHYVQKLGISVYRGSLNNVFERFQLCLKDYNCDWFFRVCADSPLLDSSLFSKLLTFSDKKDIDIVTNVYPRTFPKGHSLELINTTTFNKIKSEDLSNHEKEHVTKIFYNNPEKFKIVNVESGNPNLADKKLTVDTVEDLQRLEKNYEK